MAASEAAREAAAVASEEKARLRDELAAARDALLHAAAPDQPVAAAAQHDEEIAVLAAQLKVCAYLMCACMQVKEQPVKCHLMHPVKEHQ